MGSYCFDVAKVGPRQQKSTAPNGTKTDRNETACFSSLSHLQADGHGRPSPSTLILPSPQRAADTYISVYKTGKNLCPAMRGQGMSTSTRPPYHPVAGVLHWRWIDFYFLKLHDTLLLFVLMISNTYSVLICQRIKTLLKTSFDKCSILIK